MSSSTTSLQTFIDELKKQEKTKWRALYFTSGKMGNEGQTGKCQRGDLTRDPYAKIVYYDDDIDKYVVIRNGGNEERVPPGEIEVLLKSFIRQAPERGAFLTLAISDKSNGKEKILRVARSFEVDTKGGTNAVSQRAAWNPSPLPSSSSSTWTWLIVLVVIAIAAYFLWFQNSGARGHPPPVLLRR